MEKNSLIITGIVALLVGILGFYGGVLYQKSQKTTFSGRSADLSSRQGTLPNRQNGVTGNRPVIGEVISVDADSITVKTQDNGSKIVIVSNSTKINKTSEGSRSDLTTGSQVTVIGSENSDGSLTAQNISVGAGLFQGMPDGNQSGQNAPANP